MKKNILLSTVFSMFIFTGTANAIQIFDELPMQPNPLGQALGNGLGQYFKEEQEKKELAKRRQVQRKQAQLEIAQKQQQARILSRALSGQATPEEMAQLDPYIQLEVAKIMQMRKQNGDS